MSAPPAALITGGRGALASALRDELTNSGWTVIAPSHGELDVTDSAAVDRFISALPKLDLLVNNAGIRRDSLHSSQTCEERDAVLDVCLRGAFVCSRAAVRLMQPQRAGHIVNIGSRSAFTGPAGQTAYAAAKAGLVALTQSLASELG